MNVLSIILCLKGRRNLNYKKKIAPKNGQAYVLEKNKKCPYFALLFFNIDSFYLANQWVS